MDIEELESLLKRLNFEKIDEHYVGYEKGTGDKSTVTIKLIDNIIICTKNEKLLFQVENSMSLGGLLALFQEFRLIHERYIYERLDAIEEQFLESEY